MSTGVLTGSLLDFGNSFWDSQSVLEEFPGLLSSKFAPAGKFGIGFFAVFMLGEHVTVLSKRYDASHSDVNVLEFPTGLRSRTILRKPLAIEHLKHSGTLVRVKLVTNPEEPGGLLWFSSAQRAHTLFDVCEWLCPALDVDISAEDHTGAKRALIVANDLVEHSTREIIMACESNRGKRERGPQGTGRRHIQTRKTSSYFGDRGWNHRWASMYHRQTRWIRVRFCCRCNLCQWIPRNSYKERCGTIAG